LSNPYSCLLLDGVRNARIVELDFLNDPERLRQLDLTILED
jgi:hypothetical protein